MTSPAGELEYKYGRRDAKEDTMRKTKRVRLINTVNKCSLYATFYSVTLASEEYELTGAHAAAVHAALCGCPGHDCEYGHNLVADDGTFSIFGTERTLTLSPVVLWCNICVNYRPVSEMERIGLQESDEYDIALYNCKCGSTLGLKIS